MAKYPFESVNEYGTPVTVFECDTCGREFTACPAVPADRHEQWTGCMDSVCGSYDITRDVDIWIEAGLENGLIEREEIK